MTTYTITQVKDGILRVEYDNGPYWAEFPVTPDMTQEAIDALAYQYAPKTGIGAPAGLQVGVQRPAIPLPVDPRSQMRAYRLAFEDACSQTAYGDGTLLEAIDLLLAGLPATQRRRYENITIFERLKPEVAAFLQNPNAINLTDSEVDDLFLKAMEIEGTIP